MLYNAQQLQKYNRVVSWLGEVGMIVVPYLHWGYSGMGHCKSALPTNAIAIAVGCV